MLTIIAVAAFLAPFLNKAGEKVAEKTVEVLFDARGDLANKFSNLFKSEIISLGLTGSESPSQVARLIEERPALSENVRQKLIENQDLLNELVEAFKQMPQSDFRGIAINAKNIGAVINNPTAPISLNNKFS